MLKLFIQSMHRITLVVVVLLSLTGLILIALSLVHKIPVSFVVLVDDQMNPWLYGAGFLLILTTLFLRWEKRPKEWNERWRQRIRVFAAVLALFVALDAVFGWSSRIEPFELRMAFHGAFLVIVAVLGVISLVNSRRKSE